MARERTRKPSVSPTVPSAARRSQASSPGLQYSYNHDAQQFLFQTAPSGTPPTVQRQEQEGTSESQSVIDSRIDVRAQFALLRLFKGSPEDSADARALLEDVKQGRIKGIFGSDLGISSRMATARGTVAWELVPKGQDAVTLDDGKPDAPVIVFRASAGQAPRLDQALLTAFRQQGGTKPGRPTQHGALTVEGEPETLSSGLPFSPTDVTTRSLDTHAHRPQIKWKVHVTQNGSLSNCLVVGFLQTLTENDIHGDYSPSGICRFVPPAIPIRDGFASTPVWMQFRNAGGKGFDSLGPCVTPSPVPIFPAISTDLQAIDVALTDDPGGLFPLRHPQDSTRTLRSTSETLTFHTWLAAKPATAPERNPASYQFLRHLVWTVRRKIDVTNHPSGVGVIVRENETKIVTRENGKGSRDPVLGSNLANEAVRTCTL
jgi:hypothetical protein